MHHDTMPVRHNPMLSETARARLRELEARASLVRWQVHAGMGGSPFIAQQAEKLQHSIRAQLGSGKPDG